MTLANGLFDVPAGKLPVIITHLQMHAAPALKDIALPEGVAFRQVTPTLEWYRDVFTRVGTQEWLWTERLTLTDADLQAILDNPDVAFFTLSKDGQDEALLELDFRQKGECELAYFGMTRALIGSGAGRYLMNQAITRAWAQDITRFHVHTCTADSPQAVGFYIRSGFVPFKRQIEIDDDPRLTGFLSRDTAPAIPII